MQYHLQIQKLTIFVFLFHLVLLIRCHNKECHDNRIIGGEPVHIKDFPFLLALVIKFARYRMGDKFHGAANIISKHWALTAAHCTRALSPSLIFNGFLYARGGSSYWRVGNLDKSQHVDHKIVDFYEHPDYNIKHRFDCDIALIKVQNRFDKELEKPVAVASTFYKHKTNTPALIAGWGTINDRIQLPVKQLRAASIDIFSNDTCFNSYKDTRYMFTENMICGGSRNGNKDACRGDSGGPLLQDNVLIGIISFGIECGKKEFPGVYTKVGMIHRWIKQLEKQNDMKFGISFRDKGRCRKRPQSIKHYYRKQHHHEQQIHIHR